MISILCVLVAALASSGALAVQRKYETTSNEGHTVGSEHTLWGQLGQNTSDHEYKKAANAAALTWLREGNEGLKFANALVSKQIDNMREKIPQDMHEARRLRELNDGLIADIAAMREKNTASDFVGNALAENDRILSTHKFETSTTLSKLVDLRAARSVQEAQLNEVRVAADISGAALLRVNVGIGKDEAVFDAVYANGLQLNKMLLKEKKRLDATAAYTRELRQRLGKAAELLQSTHMKLLERIQKLAPAEAPSAGKAHAAAKEAAAMASAEDYKFVGTFSTPDELCADLLANQTAAADKKCKERKRIGLLLDLMVAKADRAALKAKELNTPFALAAAEDAATVLSRARRVLAARENF